MSTEEDIPEELRPVVHRGEDRALEDPTKDADKEQQLLAHKDAMGQNRGLNTGSVDPALLTPAGKEALPATQAAAIQFHKLSPEQENAVKVIRAMGAQIKVELSILRSDANVGADPRWLQIAETDFQKALMAAVRAVVKPDFF